MNSIGPGARILYRSNRLYCTNYRTFDENLAACLGALALLTGLTVEQLRDPKHPESIQSVGGQIDAFSSS